MEIIKQLAMKNNKLDMRLYLSLRKLFYHNEPRILPKKIIKQSGGKIMKYKVDNKYYHINVEKNLIEDNEKEFAINFYSLNEDKYSCGNTSFKKLTYGNTSFKKLTEGVLLVYDKIAIIQDVVNMEHCVLDENMKDIKKRGEVIIRMMIKVCKKLKLDKIQLSDNSYHPCGNGDRIDLIEARTLTDGYPYYVKFGFIPPDKENINILRRNYNKMEKLKTSDINFNKITKDKSTINYVENNPDDKLKKTMKYLMYDNCKKFHKIYKKIYNKIGLEKYINDNVFEMIL
jgi:hypothetical protein